MRPVAGFGMALMMVTFASCSSPNVEVKHELSNFDKKELEQTKSLMGLTIKLSLRDDVRLCPTLDGPSFQPLVLCENVRGGDKITVDQVVMRDSIAHLHVHTEKRSGYIMDGEFRLLQIHSENCQDYFPQLGMSKHDALHSNWCFPDTTNTSEIRGHVFEQLVYPGVGYLYFDNEVLTSIQNVRGQSSR